MKHSICTYWKRECKKVLPVLGLMCLYAVLVWGAVYVHLAETCDKTLLMFSYTDFFYENEVGDVILWYFQWITGDVQWAFVPVSMILLLVRLFHQENRAGVSDFLRVLPIREKDKMGIKVLTGESAIAVYSVLLGVMGTITYALLQPALQARNQMLPKAMTETNTLLSIWQIAALSFVTMSAVFLMLFLAQCVIHHFVLALIIGGGILAVPAFMFRLFTFFFEIPSEVCRAGGAPLTPFYDVTNFFVYGEQNELYGFRVSEGWFADNMKFWLVICAIASVLLVVASKYYWQLKESSKVFVNSRLVEGFLVAGLTLCAGIGVSVLSGNIPWTEKTYQQEWNKFLLVAFGYAAVVFALVYLVVWLLKRRQQKNL